MAMGPNKANAISLHQWIDGALQSIDPTSAATSSTDQHHAAAIFGDADPRKLALCSDDFLLSALKVARSLADQVCESGSSGDPDKSCSADGSSSSPAGALPKAGSTNWSEDVAVHLSSSSFNCEGNIDGIHSNGHQNGVNRALTPLPFSHDKEPASRPEELSDMLKSMIGEDVADQLLKEDGYDPVRAELEPLPEGVAFSCSLGASDYLSVSGADFSYKCKNGHLDGGAKTKCDQEVKKEDEMQQIYSLGLVFYEIFSGGEKPEVKMASDSIDPLQERELLEGSTEPLHGNGHASGPINIGKTLNIKDDDTTEDLFSRNGKHSHDNNCSTEYHHLRESVSKKKRSPGDLHSSTLSQLSVSSSVVSLEPLKSKGLPISLTELIGNMLSSIHGDLSSDETYTSMADVRADLQRMMDKPRIYLDDLDLAKLSVTGLQLHEAMFEREKEFGILKGAYSRAIGGDAELAIISGASGTGKSVLAHRLGNYVAMSGAIFLSGKFDQLQQATPFSAIAAAFNQYCDMLINEGLNSSPRAVRVASELNRVLGREAYHLTRVIPSLASLIGQQHINQYGIDQDCVDAQKRLLYLLCQFVEVISSSSGVLITLFLDDLQWADVSSIEVINQLLLISGSLDKTKQFFFCGCIREETVENNQPFLGMLASVCNFGIKMTNISLACMDEDTINTIVSEVLCLSPRLTRTLGHIVHHKSKGNPFFFSQLLIALNRDGLLRLSLSRRRWEWDEEKIQSRKIPDDVANFMSSNIGRLPKEDQMALSLLSCFGASTKLNLIKSLETQLQMSLTNSLEKCVAEGVLDKVNGHYSFSHDRLQEAAYNMMLPEERCLFHFKYGVALVACSLESQDDNMLFIATSQLNRGGPAAAEDKEQAVLVANLNLTAGKKAMEMSDFSSAYSYFDNGISFLRKGHWAEQYQLSLELFDNAAKCALFIGNVISLKYLSKQVLTFAQTFQDTLEVLFVTVSGLARCEVQQAVKKAISVLANLGEHFLGSYSEVDINMQVEQTKIMLQQHTEEELINYKTMNDPEKIMAMKFLARLEIIMQVARPSFQPAVTIKLVQLSLKHGFSPMSPIGFTYFGMLLARLGNIREGYSYVKIGRKLLARPGFNEMAGEVISVGAQVMCFVEPLQSAKEYFLRGYTAAMVSGDIINAIMSRFFYAGGSYWAGVKLETMRERLTTSRSLMENQNNLSWLAHQIPLERNVLELIGVKESDLPNYPDLETSKHARMITYFSKMYLSFMFREFEQMKTLADEYFRYDKVKSWSLIYVHSVQAFIGGLVAYWIFRKTKDPAWIEKGRKAKLSMKKWADSCKWNFQSQLFLMEAEEAFCCNDVDTAKLFYEKAISSAKEHRFINDEALAHELAGYFYMEIGQKDVSVNYFLQAHEKFHDWGAIAKANAVYEFTMASMSVSSSPTLHSSAEGQ